MTIYEEFLSLVKSRKPFKVDFKKRNMRVGQKWLIKNGEWDIEKDLIEFNEDPVITLRSDWCLAKINLLYQDYKFSTPSEKSERYRSYFYALPAYNMTDRELVVGNDREYAKAVLEGFILCTVLIGWFTWDEQKMGKWFYQGKDKDLVILREWIEER